jgi:hypothetical protein
MFDIVKIFFERRFSLRRNRFVALFCIVFFVTLNPFIFAEDIRFEAFVNNRTLSLGSAGELVLTVHGTQDIDPPALPAIDGFDVRYVGPSTQVSVVNGEYSSAKAFTYTLFPLKTGKFTIPGFKVEINATEYRTDPLEVTVVSSAPAAGTDKAQDGDEGGSPQQEIDLASRVRLLLLVPKARCYMNEKLPLLIKLYVQDLPLQDITMPQLNVLGISLGEYAQPRQYQEVVEGLKFQVVEFQTSITPTRSGKIILGPASVEGNILYRSNERKNPFGRGLMDDSFFQGFFTSYQKRPMTVSSRPVELEVLEIPREGKPADFSGGVGRFDLRVETGPAEVKVGDPVTLKISISGDGDFKAVKLPEFGADGFKAYPPQVKGDDQRKLIEQVIIPTRADITGVPSISFSYFDPVRGEYVTLVKGPFPLKVLAPLPGEEFQAVGFSQTQGSILKEDFGKDIVFIKDSPGKLRRKQGLWSRNFPLLLAFFLFVNVWAAFWGYYRYRVRLMRDEKYARRSRAPKKAREGILRAEKTLEQEDRSKFFDELSATFHSYLGDALHLPPGKAEGTAVIEVLREKGIPQDLIQRLRDLEELFDMARFSALSMDPAVARKVFDEARSLIEAIERHL